MCWKQFALKYCPRKQNIFSCSHGTGLQVIQLKLLTKWKKLSKEGKEVILLGGIKCVFGKKKETLS